MTVDDLLADLSILGWQVNNAYQRDATLWRVSLRRPVPSGDYFSDWGEGPTLTSALEEAMSKLADAEFVEETPQSYAQAPAPLPFNLLKAIGLAKPIVRRI